MTEKQKKRYRFRYQLTYEEAYNAFLALSLKWSRKARLIVMGALVAVTLAVMVLFLMDPERTFYFFVIIMAVIVTAYIFYSPVLKARKGARTVQRMNGTYEVALTTDGKVALAGGEDQDLAEDKNARALELADSFAIRMDRDTTLCIPKRIMKSTQEDAVREILSEYIKFRVYNEK